MNIEEIKEMWADGETVHPKAVGILLSIIEKYEYEDKVKWIERLLNERLVILSDTRIDSAEIEGRCKELELTLQAIRGSE